MKINEYIPYVNIELDNTENESFILPFLLTNTDQEFLYSLFYFLGSKITQSRKISHGHMNVIEFESKELTELTEFCTHYIVDMEPGVVYTDNRGIPTLKIVTMFDNDVGEVFDYVGTIRPEYLQSFIQFTNEGKASIRRSWLEFFQIESRLPVVPKTPYINFSDNNKILEYLPDFDQTISDIKEVDIYINVPPSAF